NTGPFTVSKPLTLNGLGFGTTGQLGNLGALQVGGNVNNATLVWSGPINLATTSSIGSNAVQGNALTITGAISGANTAVLIKVGTGFMLLQTINTYLGKTIVDAGTLTLNSLGSIVSSPNVTVNIGGSLTLDNTFNSAVGTSNVFNTSGGRIASASSN